MTQSLISTIEKMMQVPNWEWDMFESILETKELEKRDYLLREGQVCQQVYFLCDGILRAFQTSEDGREINTAFYFKNEFLREIESMTKNIPTSKNIQAIKACTVICIDKSKLTDLYAQSDFYQQVGRAILESLTIAEQRYSSFLTTYSPKERYLYLLKERPELIEQVPLQYLASYIGISRESLSRIRKRI